MKSLFEEMGGTYAKVGDYNLPNLSLPKVGTKPVRYMGTTPRKALKAKS